MKKLIVCLSLFLVISSYAGSFSFSIVSPGIVVIDRGSPQVIVCQPSLPQVVVTTLPSTHVIVINRAVVCQPRRVIVSPCHRPIFHRRDVPFRFHGHRGRH